MIDSGRARRVDVEYTTPTGRRVDLGLTAAPLMGGTGRVGYLFTFQDITERKRRERELQTEKRLAAIGEMAAGIAHEIRNPLASMAGSVQVLRQDLDLSAEQARLMDIVLRESRRLNEIIRSFLAYARPQRRNAQSVDLARAVREAAALLQHGTERGPAHVIAVEAADEPCFVDADEGEVRQVIWNLATNALKAMPAGGRLHVKVNRSRDQVRLSVRDEGVGIAPSSLDHVFEPFRSGFPGGTGLGLLDRPSHRHRSRRRDRHRIRPRRRHVRRSHAAGDRDSRAGVDGAQRVRAMAHRAVIPFEPRRDEETAAPAARPRVLIVDDEPSMRELLAIVLGREGYEVLAADCGGEALRLIRQQPIDLLISDIRMPDMSGVDVLRAAKDADPEVPGIVMTAFASTDTAVEALRLGASDYLTKPFDVDELKIVVRNALERRHLRQENLELKRTLSATHRFANMIGRSDAMLAVFRLIETIAPTSSTVLISGESGTGKELVARAVHFHSLRRDRPFVALNCGAMPETLLESELFGHVRGAFTGAATTKKGLIELADKGTIFLDEIGEMSPAMQVKLLRVLQERRYRRVGGTEEIDADIRILAATNRDLAREVSEGRFREDLFYRVNVIPVSLPPLRERREDIPALAAHFVERFAGQMSKAVAGLSREALTRLEHYHWPGNIRELENAMERAVALEASPMILPESLPEAVQDLASQTALPGPGAASVPVGAQGLEWPEGGLDLERHVQDLERRYIAEALQRAGGVKVRAAGLLGMTFRSFRYYLKKYEVG